LLAPAIARRAFAVASSLWILAAVLPAQAKGPGHEGSCQTDPTVCPTGLLSASYYHAAAVKMDGSVWTWGWNEYGQLGDGTLMDRPLPTRVHNIDDVIQVATGGAFTLALKADGTVWGWGDSYYGQLGELGTQETTPIQIQGLTNVVQVAGGAQFAAALKADGTVWTWGNNWKGELGDGTNTDRATPAPIPGLGGVVSISVALGVHGVALKADGSLWSWGSNEFGQLGDGTSTPNPVTGAVKVLVDQVAVASANRLNSVVLRKDGTVWTWGRTDDGQMCDGVVPTVNGTFQPTPQQVMGVSNVVTVSSGQNYFLMLKSDGTVWGCGESGYGECGTTNYYQLTPNQIPTLTNIVAINAASQYGLAIRADGTAWGWAGNSHGVLGSGQTPYYIATPVQVANFDFDSSCGGIPVCDAATQMCKIPLLAATGTACDVPCTTGSTCQDGLCVGGAPLVGPSAGSCQQSACNPATGTCENSPANDGTPCDDGDPCSTGDTCLGGACAATGHLQCPAPDECHEPATCVSGQGCPTPAAKPDGTPCSGGVCANGVCSAPGTSSAGGQSTSTGGTGGQSTGGVGGGGEMPSAQAGCGCRTSESTNSRFAWIAAAIALGLAGARRRR
jgi:MYXO-CTERM domain-containing protein